MKFPRAILRQLRPRERGQGMTEYIIIVALIAILTIGVIGFFGDSIRVLFINSGNALLGSDQKASIPEQPDTSQKRLQDLAAP